MALDDRADRGRDIGGRKPSGCNLIKQRLKQMVVLLVNQRHLDLVSCQLVRGAEPAEPGANDYHAGQCFLRSGFGRHAEA